MPDEISAAEAQEILGCSRTWVFKLIDQGAIDARKIGNYYAITRQSVEKYKADKKAAEGKK